MLRLQTIVVFLLGTVFFSAQGWCQSNVNESLETAFVWVDAVNGSDNNPGTQLLPFQTIGKAVSVAVANNAASIGTRVTINPGTYRESDSLSSTGSTTSLPITFEAATDGTAIISGADVWTGWTPYSQNPNIYTLPWPYTWGLCAIDTSGYVQPDITRRREQIYVNGFHLTQVLS